MKRSTPLTALAVAGALALAGCGTGGGGTPGSPAPTPAPPAAASPAARTTAPASNEPITAEHNAADVMFTQMMIPHHQQAVEMSDIMLAKDGLNPQVQQLAEKIKAAQGPEIERMKTMLKTWGQEPMMGPDGTAHGPMGHGYGPEMMGMLSQEELDQLKAAQGKDAAQRFLNGMIMHHRGAVDMANREVANGQNPQTVALAQQIIKAQEAEITEMETLLKQL